MRTKILFGITAYNRAIYTCIKNPVFLLEAARQLPLNTAKNPNRKTHLRSVVFWNSAGFSLVFFANVNACSPLTGIIRVGRDLLRNHPRPATYCALRTVKGRDKLCMRTTYQKPSMKFGFFHACAFLAKKQYEIQVFSRMRFSCQKPRKVMGFSGSVNGTTTKTIFLDFGFCPCKWA